MNLPAQDVPQRRDGILSGPDVGGIPVAKRVDDTDAGLGTRKVCMRTVMDQRDDYDIPIMDAGAVRALHARFVASSDNVEPESDEECDGAQLQAVKSKLDADVVPYADFGVFGPRGARFAKIVKYTAQVWDPTICTYTPKEFKGPRTLDEWRAHWRVYSFALRCFGAVDRARLQQYANHIERFHSDYANLPGGGWWIIAVADVRMRSEHKEKLRRKAEQACESNPNSGFDPTRPWDWVFALATRDRDFWTAHVKDRADQYMHHLKSKGDIIGPDAIAAAGEDGDGRTDGNATQTNKPSGSKRRQARAAGRLGGEGESEAARKRSRGFYHGGGRGSGGSGQQPRGPGGYGNYTGKGRGTYSGQVCFKWARDGECTDGPCPDDRLHVCEHCGSSWHRSFEPSTKGGKGKAKGKDKGKEKR